MINPRFPHARALLTLAAAAVLALAAGCSSMQGRGMSSTAAAGAPAAARLSAEDRVFAMQAAGGGMYEVEAGRLAATRGASIDVRVFGQMLVDHHTASNAELISLLQARGLNVPAALPPSMAAKMARLSPLSGAEFDRQFIRTAGIEDHLQQIALFQQASRDVADPALKAWFTRTLPTLRAHLEAAQSTAGRIAG